MSVSLRERGVFNEGEWAQGLGAEIALGPAEAGNEAYFNAWLRALEKLLVAKGVATEGQLHELAEAWRAAAEATPHGQPILLR
jgi:hypothetical protein